MTGVQTCALPIWNVATGQVERTLEGHSYGVWSVVFSPDGSKLASGSLDKIVRVWNVATGQVERTFEGHLDSVLSVVFLSDSSKSYLIYSVDNLKRWVTQNGLRILYLPLDYRPGCITTKGSTLVIGTNTGRVISITFHSDARVGTI